MLVTTLAIYYGYIYFVLMTFSTAVMMELDRIDMSRFQCIQMHWWVLSSLMPIVLRQANEEFFYIANVLTLTNLLIVMLYLSRRMQQNMQRSKQFMRSITFATIGFMGGLYIYSGFDEVAIFKLFGVVDEFTLDKKYETMLKYIINKGEEDF